LSGLLPGFSIQFRIPLSESQIRRFDLPFRGCYRQQHVNPLTTFGWGESMRSATTALMIAAMLALVPATTALAHGVRTEVAVGAMTVATFTHADGSPMSGVPFTVTSPAGAESFLTGNTDVHGRVVFLPDRAGAWKVRVAGADGHGAVVTVDVDSTAISMASQSATVYAHEHSQVDEPMGAHDHDHAVAGDHDHDHEPAADAPAPVKAGANKRMGGVAAGVGVLVVVFGLVFIMLRRRAG
jgi:hypothetical protein